MTERPKEHSEIGGLGCLGLAVGGIILAAGAYTVGGILMAIGGVILVYALLTGRIKFLG